ncbi:hypothetical protein BJ742DRAFT_771998 [Cladochytrium replicatum]|nr:hypothetical protein BJ742DRAFT_771998 [Cladochytrium replicatum]
MYGDLVHKEKKVGMNLATQKSFAEIVHGVVLKAVNEGNENVTVDEVHHELLKLCGNDLKDFVVVGIMLARHSIVGSPLGVLTSTLLNYSRPVANPGCRRPRIRTIPRSRITRNSA